MKKSELKSVLKVIVQEVMEAKQRKLNETSGLSGFKKSKDSSEHTENVADSKTLTPTTEPKEKEEGKKLPVVKKPASPQKVGSLKEELLVMIREALSEVDLDEMARTAGSIGSKYKAQDSSSPTGWVVKGHKTVPDGTPTEPPTGPYQKVGTNPNMGRPGKEPTDTLPVTVNGSVVGEIKFKLRNGKLDPTPIIKKLQSVIYNDDNFELAAYEIGKAAYDKADELQGMYYDDQLMDGTTLDLKIVGKKLEPA